MNKNIRWLVFLHTDLEKQQLFKVLDFQSIKEIGYILNKKNTPFKYKNGVLDNDLIHTLAKFKQFIYDESILNLKKENTNIKYNHFNSSEFDKRYILDIKRYLPEYKNVRNLKNLIKLKDLITTTNFSFEKEDVDYKYVDISCVNTPLYKYKICKLPSRGKNKVNKGDIIISRLKGTISFCIINEDDLIVSNGFTVLRPKDDLSRIIIFANLFTKNFKIQHQYLTTGSIMENITDSDVLDIKLTDKIDFDKFKKIIESITFLNDVLE